MPKYIGVYGKQTFKLTLSTPVKSYKKPPVHFCLIENGLYTLPVGEYVELLDSEFSITDNKNIKSNT